MKAELNELVELINLLTEVIAAAEQVENRVIYTSILFSIAHFLFASNSCSFLHQEYFV